jgi:hypothetical protein
MKNDPKKDIERMELGYLRTGAPAFLTGDKELMYWRGWNYEEKINIGDLYPYVDLNVIFEEENMIEMFKWYTTLRSKEMFQQLFEYDEGELEFLKDETIENQRLFMNGLADHLIVQAFNMQVNQVQDWTENSDFYTRRNEEPSVKEMQKAIKEMI